MIIKLRNDVFYKYYNNNIYSLTLLKRALLFDIRLLSHRDVKLYIKVQFNFFIFLFFYNLFYFIRKCLILLCDNDNIIINFIYNFFIIT